MYKALWAESRHSHSSWEKSTVTSLNVNGPWNTKYSLTRWFQKEVFLEIRRLEEIRDVDKWIQLLKAMISDIVTHYNEWSTSLKSRWWSSFTSTSMKRDTHLRSRQSCLPGMDAMFMFHTITVYMSQKENGDEEMCFNCCTYRSC